MNAQRPFSQALWDQTPAAVQDYLQVLEARVAALEEAVQRLEAMVQQLREHMQQDSRTSSRPPSSDSPQAMAKRPRREPTGRRPGGQPGHEGHTRALVPVDSGVPRSDPMSVAGKVLHRSGTTSPLVVLQKSRWSLWYTESL